MKELFTDIAIQGFVLGEGEHCGLLLIGITTTDNLARVFNSKIVGIAVLLLRNAHLTSESREHIVLVQAA